MFFRCNSTFAQIMKRSALENDKNKRRNITDNGLFFEPLLWSSPTEDEGSKELCVPDQ